MNKINSRTNWLFKQYGIVVTVSNEPSWVIQKNHFHLPEIFFTEIKQDNLNFIMLHDLCHYIVASPTRREMINFDLNDKKTFTTATIVTEEQRTFALQTCFDEVYNKFIWTTSKSIYDSKQRGKLGTLIPRYCLSHKEHGKVSSNEWKQSYEAYEWLKQVGLIDNNFRPILGNINLQAD